MREIMRELSRHARIAAVIVSIAATSCSPPQQEATPSAQEDHSASAPSTNDVSVEATDSSHPTTSASSDVGESAQSPQAEPYEAERPFSASVECKACHPRQYQEWRTSPHSYSGISPTFYSLVAAGQNSFGAGALIDANDGTSIAGAVGNFCLPCHAPMSYIGLEGRLAGNNLGFADVQPDGPFVCNLASGAAAFEPCTFENSAEVCGLAGRCTQFEGRSCVNMPPAQEGSEFPRVRQACSSDADCRGGRNGCPEGEDCGPCIIAPATIFYGKVGQEGINCETCHNVLPNHQRACQQFRNSDSAGVFSVDLQERNLDRVRLRLGPYPVADISAGQGRANDQISPFRNSFHESARVDTPLVVDYEDTDYPNGVANAANTDPEIIRPTAVTCEELPYCVAGICEGGPNIGATCGSGPDADFNCGGCSASGTCGLGSARAGQACRTSIDCATAVAEDDNVMNRGIADGTLGPLFGRDQGGGVFLLDRPDGNYYRSSMYCATCHDVRPPFGNTVLRSCQLQDTHVCSNDADCVGLNVGCPGNDCGPCVMENSTSPLIADGPSGAAPEVGGAQNAAGAPRNTGVRRVENLFSEWQISPYNHPDLMYCSNNSFRNCTIDADCGNDGTCTVQSPTSQVVTCQDCHMSLFPRVPLVLDTDDDGIPDTEAEKNQLYPRNKAAFEGSQADITKELPRRRVSTHYMAGVDLPLIPFPGQGVQDDLRQEILDSSYKIALSDDTTDHDVPYELDLEITNVGVGHRLPAGFSHERQNWVQLFVQSRAALQALGIESNPFSSKAPCNLQRNVATGADQTTDSNPDIAADAQDLLDAGCVYRSGFNLDKAHPETGERQPDGSVDDEDPEDFFVVAGTRVRGNSGAPGDPNDGGDARIEVTPGADGRALSIQYICEEATAEAYRDGIRDGTGIDVRTPQGGFPHHARFCDPNQSPQIPGEGLAPDGGFVGSGFTAPGYGNPDCMEAGVDLGPCVPEMELSDANERGRCAFDLTRPRCQSDADCGDAGPCLYACSEYPELECCDVDAAGTACEDFYTQIGIDDTQTGTAECVLGFEDPGAASFVCVGGSEEGKFCTAEGNDGECADAAGQCEAAGNVSICIGGANSGGGCTVARETALCGAGISCGSVGECNVENRGIVNFQNQFRSTSNGVCVDPGDPRDAENMPKPILVDVDGAGPGTAGPVGCLLNLSCTLQGVPSPSVCLVNGQCADTADDVSGHVAGDPCTNVTFLADCGTKGGNSIACNVERNLELNGRPSESVFIQNHPFNFNSLPPLEPRSFKYDFEIPSAFADSDLIVSARIMNRHFPMRFLRNLIGTQVVRPPFIIENQGDPDSGDECQNARTIDIDCFVKPIVILGNAEPGGFFPRQQTVRSATITVNP